MGKQTIYKLAVAGIAIVSYISGHHQVITDTFAAIARWAGY